MLKPVLVLPLRIDNIWVVGKPRRSDQHVTEPLYAFGRTVTLQFIGAWLTFFLLAVLLHYINPQL